MGFINSLKTCFKKYVLISGRASRSEFWYFSLFFYGVLGLIFLIGYFDYLYRSSIRTEFQSEIYFSLDVNYLRLFYGFIILTILPFVAVTVRRLHDVNQSGLWILIPFITPFLIFILPAPIPNIISLIINIIILFLCLKDGDRKDNRFGKNIYKKNKN